MAVNLLFSCLSHPVVELESVPGAAAAFEAGAVVSVGGELVSGPSGMKNVPWAFSHCGSLAPPSISMTGDVEDFRGEKKCWRGT